MMMLGAIRGKRARLLPMSPTSAGIEMPRDRRQGVRVISPRDFLDAGLRGH